MIHKIILSTFIFSYLFINQVYASSRISISQEYLQSSAEVPKNSKISFLEGKYFIDIGEKEYEISKILPKDQYSTTIPETQEQLNNFLDNKNNFSVTKNEDTFLIEAKATGQGGGKGLAKVIETTGQVTGAVGGALAGTLGGEAVGGPVGGISGGVLGERAGEVYGKKAAQLEIKAVNSAAHKLKK